MMRNNDIENTIFLVDSLIRGLEPSQNPAMSRPDDSEIVEALKLIRNNLSDSFINPKLFGELEWAVSNMSSALDDVECAISNLKDFRQYDDKGTL